MVVDQTIGRTPAEGGPERGPDEVIQGVNRVLQFQSEILSSVEDTRLAHESFGEIFPESPVPLLVGISQGGLGNLLPKAEMADHLDVSTKTNHLLKRTLVTCHILPFKRNLHCYKAGLKIRYPLEK